MQVPETATRDALGGLVDPRGRPGARKLTPTEAGLVLARQPWELVARLHAGRTADTQAAGKVAVEV